MLHVARHVDPCATGSLSSVGTVLPQLSLNLTFKLFFVVGKNEGWFVPVTCSLVIKVDCWH